MSPKTLIENEIARILDFGHSSVIDGQFVPGSCTYVDGPSYGAFGFIAIDRFMRELVGKRRAGALVLRYDVIVDAIEFARGDTSKSQHVRRSAAARWKNDPSQLDKQSVRRHWLEWKKDGFDKRRYKNPTKFADAMLDIHAHLENSDTIMRWMRAWMKEKK